MTNTNETQDTTTGIGVIALCVVLTIMFPPLLIAWVLGFFGLADIGRSICDAEKAKREVCK